MRQALSRQRGMKIRKFLKALFLGPQIQPPSHYFQKHDDKAVSDNLMRYSVRHHYRVLVLVWRCSLVIQRSTKRVSTNIGTLKRP